MKTFLKENFFKFMIGLSALILSIAVLMYIISITKSPSSLNERITGDPIRIGRLEIAEFDFPKHMYWGDAVDACRALETGWRLPTKSELNYLYKNKDKIGNFAPEGYWCRSKVRYYEDENAWAQNFARGIQYGTNMGRGNLVRAVRSF